MAYSTKSSSSSSSSSTTTGRTRTRTTTHLHDLPDAVISHAFSQIADVRTRNAMALTCRKWRGIERATRASLSLRGNIRDLFLLPACFPAVVSLDLSLLSPWGHPSSLAADPLVVSRRLTIAFPAVTAITVYARAAVVSLQWPELRHVSVVRWHPRPNHPPGSDLSPLFSSCRSLTSLDLSRFYCWPEDLPAAFSQHPAAGLSLRDLNLLCSSSSEGFRCSDLVAVAACCPNLCRFLAPCVFNPRFFDFVGDDAILAVASHCPRLAVLHLADPCTLSPSRPIPDSSARRQDSGVTRAGLDRVFSALPLLEDLTLDICQAVGDSGGALETLSYRCPRLRSLKLGSFQGICKASWLHLDGVALCGALQNLSIKNSDDISDSSLSSIARGCRLLSRFEIHGCATISETGIMKFTSMLRSTLKDVTISGCQNLDASSSLRAIQPIRDQIERLHIDCIWTNSRPPTPTQTPPKHAELEDDEFDLDILNTSTKKRRFSNNNAHNNGSNEFQCKTFERLRYLSLWIPAGQLLTPLTAAGLENCPELEEITIKVEGDCRTCPLPSQSVFGLSTLALYPNLSKMKLDCGEAIGYALTAPTGHMDLSLWERFFLHGIGDLNLYELDYWPPQDKEVNQRSLSLPASGLIQECLSLRKLFIHGTANEHFMRFFLGMGNLRDVQLREDYYPAPENDMSTEMRVDSCSRFEDALNRRIIPD